MLTRTLFVFFLITNLCVFSQVDSVKFEFGSPINDGVYLSYSDFRRNNPVTKDEIISNLDKEQLNFIEKNMQEVVFYYQKSGVSYTVQPKKIWGYTQNNTLYLNYGGEFFRVPVFGSISYLMISVLVPAPAGIYYNGVGASGGYVRENHEFLMNFYDGKPVELTMKTAEFLLSRDKELFVEFENIKKRKRKAELYRYIRKFNERNPVYFLK